MTDDFDDFVDFVDFDDFGDYDDFYDYDVFNFDKMIVYFFKIKWILNPCLNIRIIDRWDSYIQTSLLSKLN